jgi:hypothetical protein
MCAPRATKAVSHKHAPHPKDVPTLEEIAGPKAHRMGVEEFTCGVVQYALKQGARARQRNRSVWLGIRRALP